MKRIFMPLAILFTLMLSGCNLLASEKYEVPIELVAFGQLTDAERERMVASPKDSVVEKVTVIGDMAAFLDKNLIGSEVYAVTFRRTATVDTGNITVYIALDKQTALGKGFSSKEE